MKPEIWVYLDHHKGSELAAMVSVDLATGVLPDVITLELQDDHLLATRPVYAGKLVAKVACLAKPQIITPRSRAFSRPTPQPGRKAQVTRIDPLVPEAQIATRVESYAQQEAKASLSD